MSEKTQELVDKMVKATMQRHELELYGAWRAGYDYLCVKRDYSLNDIFPVTTYYPTDNEDFHWPDEQTERYDLSAINTNNKEMLNGIKVVNGRVKYTHE